MFQNWRRRRALLTRRLFVEHLVDEEFHAAWAQEMIAQVRKPLERDRLLRP